jgi:hypothetical protein
MQLSSIRSIACPVKGGLSYKVITHHQPCIKWPAQF